MRKNDVQQADAITTALQYLTDRIAVIESCINSRPGEPSWEGAAVKLSRMKGLQMAARELRTAREVIEGAVSRSSEVA